LMSKTSAGPWGSFSRMLMSNIGVGLLRDSRSTEDSQTKQPPHEGGLKAKSCEDNRGL
jgi:hypothetical protein